MSREETIQQQYPIGALNGRPMAIGAAIAAPVYSVLMAYQNREDINSPVLALASLVLMTAACLTIVFSTSPLRAPLTNQTAAFAVLWGTTGMVVGSASMWGTNAFLRDDWGPTAVGALVLSLTAYRPPRELVMLGVFAAIVAGTLALLQADDLTYAVLPIVFVLVTITPIVTMTVGAAVFSRALLAAIAHWRRTTRVAVTATGDDAEWIARSVQQDRVTILNRDIVPLFAELLQAERITDDDRDRAREIASSIRAVMVSEADRSWLHSVVDQILPPESISLLDAIVDEQRLTDRMSIDQRSAFRALLVATCGHPDFSPRGFRIVARREGSSVDVELTARISATDQRMRSELAPYFAVLRIVFDDLVVEFVQPSLALKFSYDD